MRCWNLDLEHFIKKFSSYSLVEELEKRYVDKSNNVVTHFIKKGEKSVRKLQIAELSQFSSDVTVKSSVATSLEVQETVEDISVTKDQDSIHHSQVDPSNTQKTPVVEEIQVEKVTPVQGSKKKRRQKKKGRIDC